jgi:hypothetical protein
MKQILDSSSKAPYKAVLWDTFYAGVAEASQNLGGFEGGQSYAHFIADKTEGMVAFSNFFKVSKDFGGLGFWFDLPE